MPDTYYIEIIQMHRPVANIAALKAIDTTNRNNAIIVNVGELGTWQFIKTSTQAPDDITVVQPTVGGGRWIKQTIINADGTVVLPKDLDANSKNINNINEVYANKVDADILQSGGIGTAGAASIYDNTGEPIIDLLGSIAPSSFRSGITDLPTPVNDEDAATKDYVDSHPGTNVTAYTEYWGKFYPTNPLFKSAITNGQTAFTLDHTPISNDAFTLFLNGQERVRVTDYTISGTNLIWLDPTEGGLPITLKSTDVLTAKYNFLGIGFDEAKRITVHAPITSGIYNIDLSVDAYTKFTNRGAGVDVTISLPTPVSGDSGKWIIAEYYGGLNKLTISTADPNKINYNNDPQASIYTYEYSAKLFLIVMEDLKWYVHDIGGNWFFEV